MVIGLLFVLAVSVLVNFGLSERPALVYWSIALIFVGGAALGFGTALTPSYQFQNSAALAFSIVVPYLMMESLKDHSRYHTRVPKLSLLILLIAFSLCEFMTPLLPMTVLNLLTSLAIAASVLSLAVWVLVQWSRQGRFQYLVLFFVFFVMAGSFINSGVLAFVGEGHSSQVTVKDWAYVLILLAGLVATICRLSLDFEVLSARYIEDYQQAQKTRSDRLYQASLSYLDQSRSISILSNTLAHELNQPITAVATNAELLNRYLPHEEMRDILLGAAEDIERDLFRANDLLDQYLDNRITNPVTGLSCDIVEIVKQMQIWFAFEFEDAHIRFDLMNNLPSTRVYISEVQLNQVLSNLIRNSVQALKGAVNKNKNISITLSRLEGNIVVAVSDNGPGVPLDQIANLEKSMSSKKRGGMGLGLSISRWIVERHGGSFSIWSNLGGGFHVQLTLPLERPFDV